MKPLTAQEQVIAEKISKLKEESGSHSPNIFTIAEKITELKVKIDACFLADSYATDLFIEYLKKELIETDKLRDVLEFYPSQVKPIAENLSRAIHIDADNIFIGNGATEIIQAVLQTFAKKKMIVNIPTFSPYYEFAKAETEVIFNKLDKSKDFKLDVKALVDLAKKEKPDTVIVINPNNPDGNYLQISEIKHLLDELKLVENLIVDESFIHFAFESNDYSLKSCVDYLGEFENLIIIKSMSKDFGIAGIRAGYALMNKARVKQLLTKGYLWNVSGLAEYFFKLYVREDFLKRYEKIRVKFIKETQDFFSALSKIKEIKVYPTMANFVLIELLDGTKAKDFVSKLLIQHGVYVRDCNDKIGLEGEFVRIGSRKKEENQVIVRAIPDVLS